MRDMYELIITEKPKAALKIAQALADDKIIKESNKQVPYYRIKRCNKEIVVACAVGHLFGLDEKEKNSWRYPVFDIKWKPISEMQKKADFSKKYLDTIKKLAKDANEFTVATDYDIEGEVIGLNIIKYICSQKDANRMKFSTLTKPDLIKAYELKSKHLDWGQAHAGETRHMLDWFYGINTSRALTAAIKTTGMFKIMSTGRVQGPALKLIVDREREINAFKPVPFWQIELDAEKEKQLIQSWHEKDKFWEKDAAEKIYSRIKNEKKAIVAEVTKAKFNQSPPFPFDLTSLQIESYRCLHISPKETLAVAQELYTSGYISYPRTSSQKLPKEIGYKKIIEHLANQFPKEAKLLLNKSVLKPNEGEKTDPAHPAIYPTGIPPEKLEKNETNIYELIARRFLATFGDAAVRQTMTIRIDCKQEMFIAKGTTTLEPGWHILYGKFTPAKEEELPAVEKGEELKVKKIILHEKETQPPKRYTEASIIKELEKRNLGTKCLTSKTLVKINSNNQIYHIKISELFDSLYSDFPIIHDKSMKIAKNNKKTCFSFDKFDEIKSYFRLVSKRKLNKNEKVYRIEYKDGSHIELTEDHPVLIFDDSSCRYTPVKNLKKGMKSVASAKSPEKEGNIICVWDDFLNKCNLKTKLYGNSNKILIFRKKINLSQCDFGKKYNISQSRVCEYEKSNTIPLYIIKKLNLSKPENICSVNKDISIKNPFPLKMISSLARILANLVGDCSIDSKKIITENCYDFRYHNTNIDLLNRFIKDIKTIFGIDLTVKVAKPKPGHLSIYYINIPAIIGRIISILFPEVINKNAVKISHQFYPEFIGALFDDEGHTMKSEPKLFISNTNFKLLDDVRQMLLSLGIISMLDKKQFKLYIRGRENIQKFLEKIPIHSIKKKQRLINNLSQFYKFGRELSSQQKQFLILSLINSSKNKGLANREISEKLECYMSKTKHHLNLLINQGYIKKIVTGISKYPRKKITYQLIKPLEDTFFKYLDEKVIAPDFITKTISSIKEIQYKGYVYDITNTPKIPNFILSNGVVVHNSTRAQIIDTLFQRNYITGKQVAATNLGISTIETLEKFDPEIIDEALSRHFEEEMEEIREEKKNKDEVLKEAKEILVKIMDKLKKHEKEIGKSLGEATLETREEMSSLGKCPSCEKGDLMIRRGKFGYFVGCSNYPECKTIVSLPKGMFVPAKKSCPECSYPMINAIKKGRRPQEICVNPKCPLKAITKKQENAEKKCPKCGKPMVLRSSIYGKFYGCSGYPKCRNIERIICGAK